MRHQILPPATIGIIGGGQLGKMIAMEAKAMGYTVIVLDPNKNCPCAQVCDAHIEGDLNHEESIAWLCQKSDVITYEFENIEVSIIERLEQEYLIPQSSKCLKLSQDRILEKNYIRSLGYNTAKFAFVNSMSSLETAIQTIGLPAILKTTRLGYDGKGQIRLDDQKNLASCKDLVKEPCILEQYISFDEEISVILSRGYESTTFFPIPQNIHKQGILAYSIVPNGLSDTLNQQAKQMAQDICDSLEYIGTMAIELFVKDGELYFNEMAPRVHNTGHFSLDVCNKSQCRTHVEAICGLALSPIHLNQPAIMWNVLGKDLSKALRYVGSALYQEANVHFYGKKAIETNRKMGHITFYGKDQKQLIERVASITECSIAMKQTEGDECNGSNEPKE